VVVVVADLVQDIQGKKIVAFRSKRKFYSELRLRQAIQRPVANIGIYGGVESAPHLESKLALVRNTNDTRIFRQRILLCTLLLSRVSIYFLSYVSVAIHIFNFHIYAYIHIHIYSILFSSLLCVWLILLLVYAIASSLDIRYQVIAHDAVLDIKSA